MTTEHDHHEHHHQNTPDNGKELPHFDKLLEDPVHFMPGEHSMPAVSDKDEVIIPAPPSDHHDHTMMTMKKNAFCGGMMHEHNNGVGAMTLGGGMGGGMIMYMDGFRFSMRGNQPCLNLYFPSWTLDTRWKFIAALIFVFGLSFATEAISKFRHNLTARPISREYQTRRTRQLIISGLHGFQALLGYVVMLATMTFSVEILLSVVLGLSTGYYYYFAGEVGLEGHVTTNPCCNYMQDESNEHEQRQLQQQQQQQQQQAGDTTAQAPCCNEDSATTSLLAAEASNV